MAGVGTALALTGLSRDMALTQVITQSSQPEAEKWRIEAERQSMGRADMEARMVVAGRRAAAAEARAERRVAAAELRVVAAEAARSAMQDAYMAVMTRAAAAEAQSEVV